jgi:hypothetical protein
LSKLAANIPFKHFLELTFLNWTADSNLLLNAVRKIHLFVFFGAIESGIFDELLEEWQAVLEADLDFLGVSEGNVISG